MAKANTKYPAPPDYLSSDSRKLWMALHEEYGGFTPSDTAILLDGLQHRDLAAVALAELRKTGAVLPGTSKTSPYVLASKTHSQAWLACVRALGLHLEAK